MRQAQENARQAYNQKIAEQQLQSMRAISANGGYSAGPTPVPSTPQMLVQDQNTDGLAETPGGQQGGTIQQQQMTPQSAARAQQANGPKNGAMLPPQSPSSVGVKPGHTTGAHNRDNGVSIRPYHMKKSASSC